MRAARTGGVGVRGVGDVLDGKVAVVTGAASGIGAAVAAAFSDAGAIVIGVDRDAAGDVRPLDVTDRAAVSELVSAVVAEHGRLDVMANVAGVMIRRPALELTPDELDAVLDVNLRGVLWCCQAAGRVMTEAGGGAIINASSTASVVAGPGLAAYAMSQGGVSALTRVLAAELGSAGVRVNAVAPGYTITALTESAWTSPDGVVDAEQRERVLAGVARATPVGRPAVPQEIAGAFVWLASDAAAYVTGQVIHVNGGVHMGG